MKAASSGTGVRMLAVSAPAVFLLLGWLGAPDRAAAAERIGPGLSNLRSSGALLVGEGFAETPAGAKVSRDQAIEIALKQVKGRATSVEVEQKLGKLVYTVEVTTPNGDETDVFVDVASGEVVGTD